VKRRAWKIISIAVVLVVAFGFASVFASDEPVPILYTGDDEGGAGEVADTEEFVPTGLKFYADTNPKTPNDFNHFGDVYMAGQNCVVTGTVKGSVYVGGSDVRFTDTIVDGNVYVGASTYSGNLDLDGTLYLFGNSINDDSTVDGNIYAFGNIVNLTGDYKNSVMISAASVSFAGRVEHDLSISCEELIVEDEAEIGGILDIQVGSQESYDKLPEKYKKNARIIDYEPKFALKGWHLVRILIVGPIVAFLLGMLFLRFWRKRFMHIQETTKKKFGWALLTGLGVLILTPIVGIVLIAVLWPATIFPMIAIGITAYFMAYLGGIGIMHLIGRWFWKLFNKEINSYIELATGVVLVNILFALPMLVPQLAWITVPAFMVLYITGAGAFTLSIFTPTVD